MNRKRRVRRTIGDVVEVPLGDEELGFALVLDEPLIAFFDLHCRRDSVPAVADIVRSALAFRIWVMNRAITHGVWPVIGHVSVPQAVLEPPWFFKQDPISKEVTVTKTGAEEIPPAPGQVDVLERAAVWDPEHVVDRLQDHFAGRPNKWVESLKLR
jgi:hypothetical protein